MGIARSIACSIPPSSSSPLRLVCVAPALLPHLASLALLTLVPTATVRSHRELVLQQMPRGPDVRVEPEQPLGFGWQPVAFPRCPQKDHVRAALARAPSERCGHEVRSPKRHPRRTASCRSVCAIRYTHAKPPAPLCGAVTVRSGSGYDRGRFALWQQYHRLIGVALLRSTRNRLPSQVYEILAVPCVMVLLSGNSTTTSMVKLET